MFDYEKPPAEEDQTPDYTGTKIGIGLVPVFLLFIWLGKAEMGFTAFLALGAILLAIKIRWRLRKHIWFWAIIAIVLALHIPVFFLVHWPESKTPTIAYALPFSIADFFLVASALSIAERLFSRGSRSEDEEE